MIKPLGVDRLMDSMVLNLSGGELQRVAITICLGVPADIYLIDEPSAYLDSEQRIAASKVCLFNGTCLFVSVLLLLSTLLYVLSLSLCMTCNVFLTHCPFSFYISFLGH